MNSLIERFRAMSTQGKVIAVAGAVVVLLAVVLGITAAVGGGDDSADTTTTAGETTTTTAPPPAPLTGLPVDDPAILERAAVGVKIGNNPEARPQAGLDDADIVYEEEVEGRVTRFLAVFHSGAPERVGPIRSVRLMDPFIFDPFEGMFVFSGGDQVGNRRARLQERGITFLREEELANAGARFLDPSHGNGVRPNILFTDVHRLWEVGDVTQPPPQMFSYLDEGEEFTGEPVSQVTVPVGGGAFNPTWRWMPDEGVWGRFYGDQPFRDKSGEQVTATNLVVQFVQQAGEESLVVSEQGGEMAVLADGKIAYGTWTNADSNTPTQFRTQDGNEMLLVRGQTWVHLPLAGGTLQLAN